MITFMNFVATSVKDGETEQAAFDYSYVLGQRRTSEQSDPHVHVERSTPFPNYRELSRLMAGSKDS